MKKTIHFYTHQDLDGIGCGILANFAFGNEATVSYVENYEVDRKVDELIESRMVEEWDSIYFTDLSPSKEALEKLEGYYPGQTIVLDHHRTNVHALEVLGNNAVVRWEPDEKGKIPSGTSLVYEHLKELKKLEKVGNPAMLEIFVEKVRSYDTYQWKDSGDDFPKKLQTLFTMLDRDRFVDRFMKKISDPTSVRVIDEVEMDFVNARIQQEVDSIDKIVSSRKGIQEVNIKGYNVAVMHHPGGVNVSELGCALIGRYPDIDILVAINLNYNSLNYRVVRDDIDAATIFAKPLKGGGHAKACGSPIPKELGDAFLDGIINHLKSVETM